MSKPKDILPEEEVNAYLVFRAEFASDGQIYALAVVSDAEENAQTLFDLMESAQR